jgi:hypothetical protein
MHDTCLGYSSAWRRQPDPQPTLLQLVNRPIATPYELRPVVHIGQPCVEIRIPENLEVAHLRQEVQVGLRLVGVEDDVTLRMADGFGHGGRVA